MLVDFTLSFLDHVMGQSIYHEEHQLILTRARLYTGRSLDCTRDQSKYNMTHFSGRTLSHFSPLQ